MVVNIFASKSGFEYDIRTLVSAFFQGITINYEEKNNFCMNDKDVFILVSFFDDNINVELKYDKIIVNRNGRISFEKTSEDVDIFASRKYKSNYKNFIKKLIYCVLSEFTKKKLPWGTLTGIRPTKIAFDNLENGNSADESIEYMKKTYFCTDEKAKLANEIATRELKILSDIDYKNAYSLYIGIPFCPTTCLYCSFTSYSIKTYKDYVEKYLEALFKEIDYTSTMIKKKLCSVYIGGGTPTSLSADQLRRLITRVKEKFDFTYVREFTVEAGRPDSITFDKLKVLKEEGVTRISINPQSMKQSTLDLIGRKHTVKDIEDAFNLARKAGHTNINMDIILGLPGENVNDVKSTLDRIGKLNPESLTVHTLAIKRAAYLNINKEKYEDMMPEHVNDMVEESMRYARMHGYYPYYLYRQKNVTDNLENVGYSKIRMESIYNILIMEEKQTILALGAGAVCKFVDYKKKSLQRVDNVKSVKDYIERIDDMIEKKKRFIESRFIQIPTSQRGV